MGQFGNILMIVIAINVVLAVFGMVTPTDNLIATIISNNSTTETFYRTILNTLSFGATNDTSGDTSPFWTIFGAIALGVGVLITKRDELIYGYLIFLLIGVLGIFNFIRDMFPPSMLIVGNLLRIGAIVLFTWSAVEWLRGTEK